MLIIGLTGNIASGKSIVSQYLKELGAEIIDADIIAREIVEPGTPALAEIREEFGQQVLNQDGTLNRKYLGSIVFADVQALKKLNQITHPRIREVIDSKIKKYTINQSPERLLVIDAALLIEFGIHRMVDMVWVVQVKPDLQLQRVMQRDKLSEVQARHRIDSQMPQSEKIKYADKVIYNNSTVEELRSAVKRLWEEFIEHV